MGMTTRTRDGLWLGVGMAGVVLALAVRRWQKRRARSAWTWSGDAGQSNVTCVTGASSGIGLCFAQKLAERKHDLILVARREERLREIALVLQDKHGVSVEVIAADLTKMADLEQVAARLEVLDNLELLVNNAGFGMTERFANSDIDKQIDMVTLHATASMRLTHAALPGMLARHHGAIINVSSVAAFFNLPRNVNYSATKAYLNTFTISLQNELRGSGVRVQALCPGFTHTEFHSKFENFRKNGLPEILWMNADKVVDESLDALESGEVIYVPGALNKAVVTIGRTGILNAIAGRVMR
jgi:short-subunit dehydrogenase